jgi:hypothetical protein
MASAGGGQEDPRAVRFAARRYGVFDAANYTHGANRSRGCVRSWLAPTVGAWRSLVAHTLGVRVVAGSNPAAPTKFPGLLLPTCQTSGWSGSEFSYSPRGDCNFSE